MRELLEAEGLPAHEDLLTWWSWHDGAETVSPLPGSTDLYLSAENTLAGPWHVLSLEQALHLRRRQRADHDQLGIGRLFPSAWVQVLTTDGAGDLCADAAAAGPAPLHVLDEGIEPPPPQFESLAEFVTMVIRAFDDGLVVGHPHDARAPWIGDAALQTGLRRLIIW